MIEFNIKIANFIFTIKSLFPDTFNLCKNYLTDEKGTVIETNIADIEFEREKNKKEAILEGLPIYSFTDGYLETIAIYRKIASFLSFNDGTIFHGALIEKDGEGYLFTAKSGTGKTTHIRNWVKAFPETIILNGDKPILRAEHNGIFGYGTPWSGKENYNTNKSVKLKAIIILKRDKDNHIEKTENKEAISTLLTQIHRPLDSMGIKRALEFSIKLIENVKIYTLFCNMDVDSAIVAYNGIKNL